MLRRLVLAVLAAVSLSGSMYAQTVFFGSDSPRGGLTNSLAARNAFQSNLATFGTDNIESYTFFQPDPVLSFPGTGITAQSNVAFVGEDASFAVSGLRFLVDDGPGIPGGAGTVFNDSFTFSGVVTAFGLYVGNAGDDTNVNTFTFRVENTGLGSTKNFNIGPLGPGRSNDNVFFFGLIDFDGFNRVTIIESLDADGTIYDDVTAGFANVPEPTTLGLAAVAAGGVWLVGRRRQSRRRGPSAVK